MFSCCAGTKDRTAQEDGNAENPGSFATDARMPPKKIYGKRPIRAMRRFRVPPNARRMFDLETEIENLDRREALLSIEADALAMKLTALTAEHEELKRRRQIAEEAVTEEIKKKGAQRMDDRAHGSVGTTDEENSALGKPAAEDSMFSEGETTFCSIVSDQGEDLCDSDRELEDAAVEECYDYERDGFAEDAVVNLEAIAAHRSRRDSITDTQLEREIAPNITTAIHGKLHRPLPQGESPHSWRMRVDSDLFQGEVLQVFRHSDPIHNGPYHASLFAGKRRVFVVQVQGKFKRKPRGQLCVLAQLLDDSQNMGKITKKFIKIWHKYVKSYDPNIDINLDARYNRPCGVYAPLNSRWVGVIQTPPGEEPPPLGRSLPPPKECKRINAGDVDICDPDLDSTYTLEYFSENLDFIGWKLFNFPILPEFSLSRFTSRFPVMASCITHGFRVIIREMGSPDHKFDTQQQGMVSLLEFINVRRSPDGNNKASTEPDNAGGSPTSGK